MSDKTPGPDVPPEDQLEFVETNGIKLSQFIDNFDDTVDRLYEPLRSFSILNRLFYSASALADHSLIWFLVASAMGTTKKGEKRSKVISGALLFESALVNIVVKSLFGRQRPTTQTERPHKLRQPLTSSFPSGHASAAFMWATLMTKDQGIAPAYLVIASIVAISRLHVKIHHASDIIGGIILGTVLGRLIKRVFLHGR